MHHGGDENVGHGARFGAGERRVNHAGDLVEIFSHPESARDDCWVLTETVFPVVVRKHCVGMCPRFEIVGFSEKASQGRPKSEGGKHRSGNVLAISLLHFLV